MILFFLALYIRIHVIKFEQKGPESHVIMQEISIFVILKATSTDRQTRRLHIFKTFCIYLASDNTLIILVYSDQMTSEARTHK